MNVKIKLSSFKPLQEFWLAYFKFGTGLSIDLIQHAFSKGTKPSFSLHRKVGKQKKIKRPNAKSITLFDNDVMN